MGDRSWRAATKLAPCFSSTRPTWSDPAQPAGGGTGPGRPAPLWPRFERRSSRSRSPDLWSWSSKGGPVRAYSPASSKASQSNMPRAAATTCWLPSPVRPRVTRSYSSRRIASYADGPRHWEPRWSGPTGCSTDSGREGAAGRGSCTPGTSSDRPVSGVQIEVTLDGSNFLGGRKDVARTHDAIGTDVDRGCRPQDPALSQPTTERAGWSSHGVMLSVSMLLVTPPIAPAAGCPEMAPSLSGTTSWARLDRCHRARPTGT
jgi:hypothetical protein